MLGLVLEGGGAKGAFHAGAVKALIEKGFIFDGVAGTSIGALNGALIAQGDFENCYKLWENVFPSTMLDVDDDKFEMFFDGAFQREDFSYAIKLARQAIANKGLSMSKVQDVVNNYVIEEKLRSSPIDFALVTVSVSDKWRPLEIFKEEVPEGLLKEYILASAYYPAFNRPTIQGKSYMDGGMYDNCPINPLVRRGYDQIIAIRTMSKMPTQEVVDRSIKIDYIVPSVKLGHTLDMRNSKVKFNLKLGYYDAQRLTDGLLGTKNYIKPFDLSYLVNMLESLNINLFARWSEIFGIKGNKSVLINKLVNEGRKSLNIKKPISFEESFIAIIESIADEKNMEKFKVYDIKDFIKAIKIDFEYIEKQYKNADKVVRAIEVLKEALN